MAPEGKDCGGGVLRSTIVFVLPSDKGHFLYTKPLARRLSKKYAIEYWAPASAETYAPTDVASFHALTDAGDDRFDRFTRLACELWAFGSDPDPKKACDEAQAYCNAHIEEAIGREFAAEFAEGKGLQGLQGPREKLVALKERVLRPDVALVIYDDSHVYSWIGGHLKEYGVPSLGLVPTPIKLWRPDDDYSMDPDNLDEEPNYAEVEGLRADKASVPHSKCYTLFPPLLPSASVPGVLAGPVLCPDDGFVPREQAEAFSNSDLKAWIESSTTPVVYVCFGSMLRGHPLLEEIWPKIMREAAGPGYRILYAGWVPPGSGVRPGEETSLRVEDWVPQAAVLAHTKVQAFVSHCGATSVNESITFGKPLIGVPFFHDQRYNGSALQKIGASTACLMTKDFQPSEAKAGIEKALTSSKVRETLRDLSSQIRALNGLERVVTEAERIIAKSERVQ